MNTVTQTETLALSAVAAAAAIGASVVAGESVTVPEVAPYELRLIPLSRLRPSRRNVRQSGGTAIPELAASIARVGLLQNLTVITSPDGRWFEVVAGRRRLAALKLQVKRRKLAKDHPVPCLLVPDTSARTVSLTENLQREAMHPADQFEAFAALVAEGRPIEDIAADFGVTPLVVQRRLKLANVSPRLLADYRAEAVTLEQLMALAITDDHAAQEAAFYGSPHWQRSPQALREHLTHEEIDASRDALARFVGVEAYQSAGGGVRRDLFADDQTGVFLADPALLDALARDKLAAVAEQVRAERWGWVEVAPRATHADLHRFQRVRCQRRAPNKAEAKRIAHLEAEQSRLQERLDEVDDDLSDEAALVLQDQFDELGKALDTIEHSLLSYPPEAMAQAGAVVSLDREGGVLVHRGLLKPEQAKEAHATGVSGAEQADGAGSNEATDTVPPRATLSEKLVKRLSAHRTAALQAEVARHPEVALVLLVHRLAQRAILGDYSSSPVNINANPQDRLEQFAPDVSESRAVRGLREVREAWGQRLPQNPQALLTELQAMPTPELLSLLALCVGLTVNAMALREDETPASVIAQAVGLDMHDWWTPTAEGYFDHVSKGRTLEAVRVFAPDQVDRLTKLKKADISREAERLSAGSGWLPALLDRPLAPASIEADPDGVAVADTGVVEIDEVRH